MNRGAIKKLIELADKMGFQAQDSKEVLKSAQDAARHMEKMK